MRALSRWHVAVVAYVVLAAVVLVMFLGDAGRFLVGAAEPPSRVALVPTDIPPDVAPVTVPGADGQATATAASPAAVLPTAHSVSSLTWLATPHGNVPTYAGPGGPQIGYVGLFHEFAITVPVLEGGSGWYRVRLPERPNGATAWVRAQDVDFSTTPYHVVIDLSDRRLTVYRDGAVVSTMPTGLGKSSTPTPTGPFFVTVKEIPGEEGYGPVVLNTSGHSEAIASWQGSGDALIAIHGPISADSDRRIGTGGANLSNGCVRLHEADQLKLADIPQGTPVDIVR